MAFVSVIDVCLHNSEKKEKADQVLLVNTSMTKKRQIKIKITENFTVCTQNYFCSTYDIFFDRFNTI